MKAFARAAIFAGELSRSVVAGDVKNNHGYKSSRPWLPRDGVPLSLSSEPDVSEVELPNAFDWRDVGGRNFVTEDVNQHIPQYCGSCWIHGTVAALNDRIKIMRKGKFPDVALGRQAVMNCVPAANGTGPPPGCDGGDAWMIHRYLHHNKVPDETCMPYQARNMGCSPDTVCRNCLPGGGGCWAVEKWTGYGVSSYGNLSGEAAMMKEIYARGPITCSFATDSDFMMHYADNVLQNEGVYMTDKAFTSDDIDHVMEVAGWGETASGVKYWVVRNSWGTYWGNMGWLKLKRGVNMLMSESDCDWAVPTWDDLDESLAGRVMGDYIRGVSRVQADSSVSSFLAGPGWSEGSPVDDDIRKSAASGAKVHTAPSATVVVGYTANTVVCLVVASLFVGMSVASASARYFYGSPSQKEKPLLG